MLLHIGYHKTGTTWLQRELFGGKHYRDQVYGGALRIPVRSAMLRTDLVATRLDDGDWYFSGIVNLDYSFDLAGRSSYVFAEYYHNDFGVEVLPPNPALAESEWSRLPDGLARVDEIIGDSAFVLGDAPTIADCTLLAALNFANFGQLQIDAGYANLHRWFENYALRHL